MFPPRKQGKLDHRQQQQTDRKLSEGLGRKRSSPTPGSETPGGRETPGCLTRSTGVWTGPKLQLVFSSLTAGTVKPEPKATKVPSHGEARSKNHHLQRSEPDILGCLLPRGILPTPDRCTGCWEGRQTLTQERLTLVRDFGIPRDGETHAAVHSLPEKTGSENQTQLLG